MKLHLSEIEMAKVLIEYLKTEGWEVYQEVRHDAGYCDIVAVCGKIQWAIECKTSMGFPVLSQAYRWVRWGVAHYVSVGVPNIRAGSMGAIVCEQFGIGAFRVEGYGGGEIVKPRFHRYARGFRLSEEQKTFCPAGTSCGGGWSPFKNTKQQIMNIVAVSPGIRFDEMIKRTDHHYGSLGAARSNLRAWISKGLIPVDCRIVERRLCVFPRGAETGSDRAVLAEAEK